MKRCLIVGAGEFPESCRPDPQPGDLLIAADGGLTYLTAMSLTPDILVADFDSLNGPAPDSVSVMRFKTEKDDTDMGLSIAVGRRQGYTSFHLYGGTGGRPDHTYANYQAITALARDGMQGFLYGDSWVATAICNSSLCLKPLSKGTVSVFSVDALCKGVSLEGLKYPLQRAELTNFFPLGVSNELIGLPAKISVEDGVLLIFCPAEAL